MASEKLYRNTLNYHGHKKVSAEMTANNSCTAEIQCMYNGKKIVRIVIGRGKDLPSVAIDIKSLLSC